MCVFVSFWSERGKEDSYHVVASVASRTLQENELPVLQCYLQPVVKFIPVAAELVAARILLQTGIFFLISGKVIFQKSFESVPELVHTVLKCSRVFQNIL